MYYNAQPPLLYSEWNPSFSMIQRIGPRFINPTWLIFCFVYTDSSIADTSARTITFSSDQWHIDLSMQQWKCIVAFISSPLLQQRERLNTTSEESTSTPLSPLIHQVWYFGNNFLKGPMLSNKRDNGCKESARNVSFLSQIAVAFHTETSHPCCS